MVEAEQFAEVIRLLGGVGKTLTPISPSPTVAVSGDGDVLPAVGGRRIKVYAYEVQSLNDGMTIKLRDGNGGTILRQWTLNAREGAAPGAVDPPAYLFATTAGNALYADITGTGTVNVAVSSWSDDAT